MKRGMSSALLAISLASAADPLAGQSPPPGAMLFPGGASKAVILSYDDGPVSDRRLVALMNRYGLRGTFHLNSSKLGTNGYVTREEVRELYRGHEVSSHSVTHPNLTTLSKDSIAWEFLEDRRQLEALTGSRVRGMAYPFGNYNDLVIETLGGLGVEYARTVDDTYGYSIPTNFLAWNPSIHQFGKAYETPDDPSRDSAEVARFYRLVDDFVATDSLALLEIWGHSWENDGTGDRWAGTERFFSMVAGRPDICSLTHITLVDYLKAYRGLRYSADGNAVTNPALIDVFLRIEGKARRVAAGGTLTDLRIRR